MKKRGFIRGEPSQNKLLKRKFSEKTKGISKAPWREKISTEFNKIIFLSLSLSEIHFENRKKALQQKPLRGKTILPLSRNINHQFLPVKNILMKYWREPTSFKTDLPRTSNWPFRGCVGNWGEFQI